MAHLTALSVCLTASLLTASANPIEYTVHSGYFEKNNFGLTGEASHLAITDGETFDKVFGVAFTMSKKPKILPVNAFDTRIVVAAIKRGRQVWEYKVEGATAGLPPVFRSSSYGSPFSECSDENIVIER